MAQVTETGQRQLAAYRASPPLEDEGKIRLTILLAAERGTFNTTDELLTHLADADEVYSDEVWEAEIEQMEQEGLLDCPVVYGDSSVGTSDPYGMQEYVGSSPDIQHSAACTKCGESTEGYSDFSVCVKCVSEQASGAPFPKTLNDLEVGDISIKFEDL